VPLHRLRLNVYASSSGSPGLKRTKPFGVAVNPTLKGIHRDSAGLGECHEVSLEGDCRVSPEGLDHATIDAIAIADPNT